MARRNYGRRGRIVIGVVVSAFRVVHTVVVCIGIVYRCCDSLCVVYSSADIDDHLRIGLDGQRAGEIPYTIPYWYEALSLVSQLAVTVVVVIRCLCIGGGAESDAKIVELSRLGCVVIKYQALVILKECYSVVFHATAIVEFLDDNLAGLGSLHLQTDGRTPIFRDNDLS